MFVETSNTITAILVLPFPHVAHVDHLFVVLQSILQLDLSSEDLVLQYFVVFVLLCAFPSGTFRMIRESFRDVLGECF